MNKDYEKWIEDMFEKYKHILFIDKYQIYFKYIPERFLASRFHYPYLNFTIDYGDKAVKNWLEDKVEAERDIIHEFCHAVTDPFYFVCNQRYVSSSQVENERERLTDHIAKILSKNLKL